MWGLSSYISYAYTDSTMKNLTQAKHPAWGELIKSARKELGETQAVFARRFKVSQAAVAQWETGVVDPPGEVTWWLLHNKELIGA